MQRHIGVQLDVAVQNREELLQRLDDNTTDIVVMIGVPRNPAIVSESFAPHPFVIVAAPDHPLAGKRDIPLSALVDERFIVREKGSDTWLSMKENFVNRFGKLHAPLEIKSTEAIKQAVMAGLGVSFLSAHTIGFEIQAGLLTVLDVEGFPVVDNWQVVHRADKQLAPAALAFKQFLLDEGAGHLARLSNIEQWLDTKTPRRERITGTTGTAQRTLATH
jgi:DNA-binding transcriptional LysR family regulator